MLPREGFPAGTAWADIPDDWCCPDCGVREKVDFEAMEVSDDMSGAPTYKLFVCVQCGFEYDEAKGWPEDGIAPGTRWDDIPEDWSCPDCGAAKSDFEMVEVARP